MAAPTDRVKQILSWYSSDNVGVKTNLARLLNHGTLAGTGKLVILPVDQGFVHGPARSFAPNPPTYDPDYHFQLAIDSGCNAYAAPLGFLESAADKFAGQIPTILKLNNSDTLAKIDFPCSAVTGSVKDAVRLGCVAIGYTIYPGSGARNRMYEDLRGLILEAKEHGLPTIVWAYPRRGCSLQGGRTGHRRHGVRTAQISCQLGAHVVKIKPPKDFLEQPEAKKMVREVRHPDEDVGRACSALRAERFQRKAHPRLFSGGESKGTDDLLEDVRGIAAGGGFGSIMGRNAFQRPRAEALKLLADVMEIFRKAG